MAPVVVCRAFAGFALVKRISQRVLEILTLALAARRAGRTGANDFQGLSSIHRVRHIAKPLVDANEVRRLVVSTRMRNRTAQGESGSVSAPE